MTLALQLLCFVVCHGHSASALSYADVRGRPYPVEMSARGLRIANRSTLLLSGDVHYARALPSEQVKVLRMLKDDGLNTVQTYAFWAMHEPRSPPHGGNATRRYCWGERSGDDCLNSTAGPRANVTAFLERAANVGLWVSMRIGPFICGEWSYGGIPAWINSVPGMTIRNPNPAWQSHMTSFVKAFYAQIEPWLAKNGGPIIMLQLENEAGPARPTLPYVQYVSKLAASLNSQLPFLWCGVQPPDVPQMQSLPLLVPAYNGNTGAVYADQMDQLKQPYPLMWTENEGWYHPWGTDPIDPGLGLLSTSTTTTTADVVPPWDASFVHANASPEEMAMNVAAWVARGGAFMNYYMYFGGQHHYNAAAAGNLNSYADGVNIHADTLPNENRGGKRTHLARLHHILRTHADAIMTMSRPIPRLELCSGECANETVGFDFGDIALLENGAGPYDHHKPHRHHNGIDRDYREAVSACSATNFSVNSSTKRWKGLMAGPADAKTADACALACCALGSTHCSIFEYSNTYHPPCWVGHATRAEGSPPKDLISRALAKPPSPYSPPSPPRSPTNHTVTFRGRTYNLPYSSVTIVAANGSVLYNTREVMNPSLQRVNTVATKQPLVWKCWSEKEVLLNGSQVAKITKEPQEQLSMTTDGGKTIDTTEYLLYSADVPTAILDKYKLASGVPLRLEINSMLANAFVPFVNGQQQPEVFDTTHGQGPKRMATNVTLPATLQDHILRRRGHQLQAANASQEPYSEATSTVRLSLLSVSLGTH